MRSLTIERIDPIELPDVIQSDNPVYRVYDGEISPENLIAVVYGQESQEWAEALQVLPNAVNAMVTFGRVCEDAGGYWLQMCPPFEKPYREMGLAMDKLAFLVPEQG